MQHDANKINTIGKLTLQRAQIIKQKCQQICLDVTILKIVVLYRVKQIVVLGVVTQPITFCECRAFCNIMFLAPYLNVNHCVAAAALPFPVICG